MNEYGNYDALRAAHLSAVAGLVATGFDPLIAAAWGLGLRYDISTDSLLPDGADFPPSLRGDLNVLGSLSMAAFRRRWLARHADYESVVGPGLDHRVLSAFVLAECYGYWLDPDDWTIERMPLGDHAFMRLDADQGVGPGPLFVAGFAAAHLRYVIGGVQ